MSKKTTINEFKFNANLKHNNKYIYDEVTYINTNSKVSIKCKDHGIFLQSPHGHLKGKGCPKCYFDKKRCSLNEFIEKANKKHNNIYTYNSVIYINWKTKIDIRCEKHGIFSQTPDCHLQGKGCPKCRKSKSETKIGNILESNNIKYTTEYYFEDLRDKGLLRFDFALFDKNNNLYSLVEYNGRQHYKFEHQFNKDYEEFISSQHRDMMKLDYCKKHDLKLNVIKYDENLENSVLDIISLLLTS